MTGVQTCALRSEYYSKKDYSDSILGHYALPWVPTNKENEARILSELDNLADAVEEFYK